MPELLRVVVAGASSGIGAAVVRALAEDGHHLHACARGSDRLATVVDSAPGAVATQCDVSEESQVISFVKEVGCREAGVDALINCVGAYGPIGPVEETDSDDWVRTIGTNLLGAYYLCKHFTPLLRNGNSATILNFAGGGAFNPFPNYSAYAVSKAAVVRLTETLAAELSRHRITVNAFAPGFVATGIHQATLEAGPAMAGAEFHEHTLKMLAEGAVPIEWPVACVRYMLSERARGLTGKTISISFDPWASEEFRRLIPEINDSGLYTMQRINLCHLEGDDLRRTLGSAPRWPAI